MFATQSALLLDSELKVSFEVATFEVATFEVAKVDAPRVAERASFECTSGCSRVNGLLCSELNGEISDTDEPVVFLSEKSDRDEPLLYFLWDVAVVVVAARSVGVVIFCSVRF